MTKTAFSLLLALSCSIILACGGGGNTTPDGEGAALPLSMVI